MQSTYSYANASIARQAFSSLWTAIIWHPLPNCTFSSIPNREEKKRPFFDRKLWVIDTLHVNQCQIYFPLLYSCLSLCLSLLCDPIFLRSQPLPLKVSSPLGSPNVFCFPPFSSLLLFVSFIFVIVHVQASLTRWIC